MTDVSAAPVGGTPRLDRRVEGVRTLAAVCIVIASLKLAADLLVPVLLAAFFAMALLPLAERLQQKGVPAVLATVLAFATGALLVLALAALVASSLSSVEERLPYYEERVKGGVDDATTWLRDRGVAIPDSGLDLGLKPEAALSFASGVIGSLGVALSDSVVVLFVMLLLMFERAAMTGQVASSAAARGVEAKLQRVAKSVTDYLSVKTVISILTGLLFGIVCALIGVDFPVLWGLLAFLLNYVPNVGSIIAAIPPILVALVQLGVGSALLVVLGNVAVNSVLGNIIEPRLMGQKVGLSTLTIFLGLVFWSWVFGPIGTVLSVPLTIVVKMLLEPPDPALATPD